MKGFLQPTRWKVLLTVLLLVPGFFGVAIVLFAFTLYCVPASFYISLSDTPAPPPQPRCGIVSLALIRMHFPAMFVGPPSPGYGFYPIGAIIVSLLDFLLTYLISSAVVYGLMKFVNGRRRRVR
jgi:hypothetical protein